MADRRRPELHDLILERTSTVNGSGERKAAEIPCSASDDEVEFPVFVDNCGLDKFQKIRGESDNSVMDEEEEEEEISDDDDGIFAPCGSNKNRVVGSGLVDRLCMKIETERERIVWSSASSKDRDELLVNEDQAMRSRIGRGGKGKTKPRSAYNFQRRGRSACEEDHRNPMESGLLDGLEDIEWKLVESSGVDLVCSGEIGEVDEGVSINDVSRHGFSKNSMAELLDELRDKEGIVPASAKAKGRRRRLAAKRSLSSLGNRSLDDDDPFEDMNSESNSENGEGVRSLNTTSIEGRHRSVAELFEEALVANAGASVVAVVPRQVNVGLLGRLQRVMQREKEQDLEFSRMLHSKASLKQVRSMVVKILRRSFEAKLTVCCCSIWNNRMQWEESFQGDDFGKTRTVIFSSRICGGVDLEVGKMICIFEPWKEVEAFGGSAGMILATYFSYV